MAALLTYSYISALVCDEHYLRSISSIKSFQFPSSRSIITTSLIIARSIQKASREMNRI